MVPDDLLRRLVNVLEAMNVPYALGGSIASVVYGEPRATLDIDVVVALTEDHIPTLKAQFPPPFYLDEQAAREAIADGAQFNIIDPGSGMKVDVFAPSDSIAQGQITRHRRILALPDLTAAFSPPEELILKKLQYYSMGGSDKHLRDIGAMLRISPAEIDLGRVRAGAEAHGLLDLWEQLLTSLE